MTLIPAANEVVHERAPLLQHRCLPTVSAVRTLARQYGVDFDFASLRRLEECFGLPMVSQEQFGD